MKYLVLFLIVLFAHAAENPHPLFVFVGEKISVEALPQQASVVEYPFKATYRNLQNVYGELPLAAIEFNGADEFYTPPRFAKYDHALIYVYLEDGKYHHVKHLFSPLYLTKDGRWAAPLVWTGYTPPANVSTMPKPVDIEFPPSANRDLSDAQVEHLKYYPEIWVPQFKLDGNTMVPVLGNYVPELLELSKIGVLKDMGWFK